MKKKFVLALVAIIFICILVWSSQRINITTCGLLRTHLFSPAKLYHRQPKILCWILTVDLLQNYKKRWAVRNTWGRRCDKLLIVTNGTLPATKNRDDKSQSFSLYPDEHDGRLLRVALLEDNRAQLWHKVVAAFSYIHQHYADEYDWFMKADDDTYVLVDNLRLFLRNENSEEPIYFGRRFKPYVDQGYMSGGAGYVLSRRALELLVKQGFNKKLPECHLKGGVVEDTEMGRCLQAVGVKPGDTRDLHGKPTFFPVAPTYLFSGIVDHTWYTSYDYYGPSPLGPGCCSNRPISFHYVDPPLMYFIDYILYGVKKAI